MSDLEHKALELWEDEPTNNNKETNGLAISLSNNLFNGHNTIIKLCNMFHVTSPQSQPIQLDGCRIWF